MELNNQYALITGGASGIGAATARYLTQRGVKVAILDNNATAVNQIAKEINGLGLVADVSDEKQVEHAFEKFTALRSDCRICINCAGIVPGALIVDKEGPASLAEFNRVIQINLIGTFNVMRLAANLMSKLESLSPDQSRGIIINTASIAAFEGQVGQAAYAASKGGVASLTVPAARELAKWGIRVVCIAPGLIDTPMLRGLPEKIQEDLKKKTVFPQRLGMPEEVARLTAQAIENELMNGCIIRLDGCVRI